MESKNAPLANVDVRTSKEARRVYLNITKNILLSTIVVKFKENFFTDKITQIFSGSTVQRRKKFGVIGGSAAVIAGAGVATVGAALMPFTFGASIGVMASGALISVAGAGLSVGVSVESFVQETRMKETVTQALVQLCQLQRDMSKLIVVVDTTHEIISDMINTEESESDIVLQGAEENIPPEIADKINKAFVVLSEYIKAQHTYDTFDMMCKDLAHLAKTLKNVFKLIIDYPANCVDIDADHKIEDAFSHPFDYLFRIPESSLELTTTTRKKGEDQTLLAFWLKHLDVILERKGEHEVTKLPTNTSLSEHKVLHSGGVRERLDISEEYDTDESRQLGIKILKLAKGISAAKDILQTSKHEMAFEFLGKLQFDFFDKDEEDWPSAIMTISDIMFALNSCVVLDQPANSVN